MTLQRLLATASLAAAAVAILAWPSDAQAWGPLAHLNFSAQALGNLGAVQPSIRMLLQDFGNEFLYGSLAADIVVGKNMARYLYHCHNWRVGFNVLKQAKPGGEQAFALGFLAHLSADTVAHNYYVPFKTVGLLPQAQHEARLLGAPLRPADGPRPLAARPAGVHPRDARPRRLPRPDADRRLGDPVRRVEAALPLAARERARGRASTTSRGSPWRGSGTWCSSRTW